MKRAATIAVTILSTILAACLALSLPAAAHSPQQAPHQSWSPGDLKLESGEVIKDFSISYVTHCKPNETFGTLFKGDAYVPEGFEKKRRVIIDLAKRKVVPPG